MAHGAYSKRRVNATRRSNSKPLGIAKKSKPSVSLKNQIRSLERMLRKVTTLTLTLTLTLFDYSFPFISPNWYCRTCLPRCARRRSKSWRHWRSSRRFTRASPPNARYSCATGRSSSSRGGKSKDESDASRNCTVLLLPLLPLPNLTLTSFPLSKRIFNMSWSVFTALFILLRWNHDKYWQ